MATTYICDDSPDGFHVREITPDEKREFRAGRIALGWVPENATDKEKILIEQYKTVNMERDNVKGEPGK